MKPYKAFNSTAPNSCHTAQNISSLPKHPRPGRIQETDALVEDPSLGRPLYSYIVLGSLKGTFLTLLLALLTGTLLRASIFQRVPLILTPTNYRVLSGNPVRDLLFGSSQGSGTLFRYRPIAPMIADEALATWTLAGLPGGQRDSKPPKLRNIYLKKTEPYNESKQIL